MNAACLAAQYTVTSGGITPTMDYFYLGNLLVASRGGDGSPYYQFTDHLGSVRSILGSVNEQYSYDPWGVPRRIAERTFTATWRPRSASRQSHDQRPRTGEALDAITKAWRAGFRDADWARRDPTLALIHDEPEFQKLYPEKAAGG